MMPPGFRSFRLPWDVRVAAPVPCQFGELTAGDADHTGIGKIIGSPATASIASAISVDAHRGEAVDRAQHLREHRLVAGRAERVHAFHREREPHTPLDFGGLGVGLVPRRRGAVLARSPRPGRRGLDRHHPDVAVGAELEQRLGVSAVAGVAPHARVHRKHHSVEVVASNCFGVCRGCAEVVPRDADEPAQALVARIEQRRRPLRSANPALRSRSRRAAGADRTSRNRAVRVTRRAGLGTRRRCDECSCTR